MSRLLPIATLCTVVLLALPGAMLPVSGSTVPIGLKTEALVNPVGLDTLGPRFSWRLETSRSGAAQTAYHIQAASSPEKINNPDLWDSGKVLSDQSHLVEYAGGSLRSRQRVWWRVRTWDESGNASPWSETEWFVVGLLGADDWQAKWIKAPGATNLENEVTRLWQRLATPPVEKNFRSRFDAATVGPETIARAKQELAERLDAIDPAPLMRKSFALPGRLRRAHAYVSGLGMVELRLNGRKVGEDFFGPAVTPYDKRAFYLTYDVTDLLQEGENAVAAIVLPGQFNQPAAFATPARVYGEELPLIVQIEAELESGRMVTIITDESWKSTVGPIVKSHFWLGEAYDATAEPAGWDAPGFDDSRWTSVAVVAAPTQKLAPQMMPRERLQERVAAEALTEPFPGVWVVKFPKAITGMVELRLREPRGTAVAVRYAERLIEHTFPKYLQEQSILHYESFDLQEKVEGMIGPCFTGIGIPSAVNLLGFGAQNRVKYHGGTPTDLYISKGTGVEVWHRRSAYTPFQYVELTGLTQKPTLETVTALVIHANLEPTGAFTSSSPLFNAVNEASLRSLLYCTHEFVQDNPGREKGHYPCMATLNQELSVYNRDYFHVWRKILDEYLDTMKGKFHKPAKKPATMRGQSDADDDIYHEYHAATLPLAHYAHYGDRRALEKSYVFARGLVDYYLRNPAFEGYLRDNRWGDYAHQLSYRDLPPPKFQEVLRRLSGYNRYIATAMLHEAVTAVAQTARILDRREDAAVYEDLAAKVGTAIHEAIYDPIGKTYGAQSLNSWAVMHGFAPRPDLQRIADNTVRDMDENFNGHFAIGHHSIQFLFQMLSEYGHGERAYELMAMTKYPSLGHMLTFGTQSILDQWPSPEGEPPDGIVQSENTGHVEWFYKYLCGIRPDFNHGGYKHFFLQPIFPEKLRSAGLEFLSPYGRIASAWKREEDTIRWSVTVPWNTTATIKLAGFARIAVNGNPVGISPFDLPAGKWEIALER